MATEYFLNYELNFFGYSTVTCNDKGIIVHVGAVPFKKYIGMHIDALDRELIRRGKEKGSAEYKGIKFLGRTKNSRLTT